MHQDRDAVLVADGELLSKEVGVEKFRDLRLQVVYLGEVPFELVLADGFYSLLGSILRAELKGESSLENRISLCFDELDLSQRVHTEDLWAVLRRKVSKVERIVLKRPRHGHHVRRQFAFVELVVELWPTEIELFFRNRPVMNIRLQELLGQARILVA